MPLMRAKQVTSSTDKTICRDLASQLRARGVRFAVLSPGSRNAPIAIAIERTPEINTLVVIDERSAAFIALGYATISNSPVALVCTSGTALLNYAPAVAEAFYRKIPLIVISADRPFEWIDQDDSQTIRQFEALTNIVKASYTIPDNDSSQNRWFANRIINDALATALSGRTAPVHINIQLDEPLNIITDCDSDHFRNIELVEPTQSISPDTVKELALRLTSPTKVMIVAGFLPPQPHVNNALARLSHLPNVVILTETVANLHSPGFISCIDTTLSALTNQERQDLAPDVVITLGGALISRMIKSWLRDISPITHWHVGLTHTTVDCFRSLTTRINMEPQQFFPALAAAIQCNSQASSYALKWQVLRNKAISTHQAYITRAPWSDLKAFATIMPLLPKNCNVQLSNGTPIRYAQLMGNSTTHRTDCNRGVSGIDGCTSTAIGAAIAYPQALTVLITGDMSAQYDISALTVSPLPSTLRIIVIANSGGGIFRFINSTKALPEREKNFAASQTMNLPLKELATAFNFRYFAADSETSLRNCIPSFIDSKSTPAILEIKTPPQTSADVLTNYFTRNLTYQNKEQI